MRRSSVRLNLEQLEDRCTPSSLSFTTALGGGNSAVLLNVNIQYPLHPGDPIFVSVQQVLPNGNVIEVSGPPIAPQTAADVPLHDVIPPNPIRGLLESAQVNSSVFIVPEGGFPG